MDFWQRAEALLKDHTIIIDRPGGSRHPRFPALVYPLDYGYLQGTSAGDGNEIDVWRGSLAQGRLAGIICTIDSFKQDAEIKLLVDCTEAEIAIIEDFHNRGDVMSGLVIKP